MPLVRRYEPKDFEQIKSWLAARNLPTIEDGVLPQFGQIMDGVACGFLINTDSDFAILDYFFTNPHSSWADRVYATKSMLEGAINRATLQQDKYAIGFSKSRGTLKFAKRYGFTVDKTPYYLFRKKLETVPNTNQSVRAYEPKDFEMIKPWLCDDAKEWIGNVSLPNIGFVIDDLACIFMIKTGSKVAIIDCFATNRNRSIRDRMASADMVCDAIQQRALADGFSWLIGNTRSAKGLAHFTRHGFKYDPQQYFFIRKRLGLEVDKRLPDPNFGRVEKPKDWMGWLSL